MASGNALFRNAAEGLMGSLVDLDTDDIRAILVDANDWAKLITGATNASPIVITSTSHGYANGNRVSQSGVLGNTAANGVFKVAGATANTYELKNLDDTNTTGNGTYTSGGFAVNLTTNDFLDDIPSGARVKVSGTLAGPTITNGVFDINDYVFGAVSGDQSEFVVYYKHTGVESTSRLLFLFVDGMTGMPVTPNGGDINVTIAAAGLVEI